MPQIEPLGITGHPGVFPDRTLLLGQSQIHLDAWVLRSDSGSEGTQEVEQLMPQQASPIHAHCRRT